MSAIIFDNVSFSYPCSKKNALSNINLSVEKGEFLAVMGENGAGKTTFCKLINGIIPHLLNGRAEFSGSVIVDGINTKDSSVPDLSRKAGIVLDDPDAQIFTSSVFREAAFGPENICVPPDEIRQRVESALSSAGLSGFDERVPSTLSGGEKQRLSIAAALAMKTEILVLDEPLCRLDPKGAEDVMSVLNDIKEKQKITVIMASHNSEMMFKYADRICVLKDGKIAALDTPENIFANHDLLEQTGIQTLNNNPNFTVNQYESSRTKEELLTKNSCCSCGPRSKKPIIEISNFSFNYSNGASIENINLSIYENDFAALIGSNGCGKTTLLKNITGLLRPSSGEIFISGKDAKKLSISDISKEIGFVMQTSDNQLFTDSVYNEVAFALKNARLPKNEIKKRVNESLDTVGIKDGEAFPHALSRSDRTRVVAACVLAMGCKTLIFDEADVGNDYKGNINIMNFMQELNKKGFTIIFVTHNMSLAFKFAHRLIKMERKGIAADERK